MYVYETLRRVLGARFQNACRRLLTVDACARALARASTHADLPAHARTRICLRTHARAGAHARTHLQLDARNASSSSHRHAHARANGRSCVPSHACGCECVRDGARTRTGANSRHATPAFSAWSFGRSRAVRRPQRPPQLSEFSV
eukprot:1555093-Pleurochrysis_carterae.AAC.1